MSFPLYKRRFRKTLNDPEYSGQMAFDGVLENSVIVSTDLSIDQLREGYYLLHINEYGYVGLGNYSKQGIIGYVLLKRPLYIPSVDNINDFKFVLISRKSATNGNTLVVLEPKEDKSTHWDYLNWCSFFMSYSAFGMDFYTSVSKWTEADVYQNKYDFLGKPIKTWQDVIARFDQLDDLVLWATHNADVGSRTYGTKRRSEMKMKECSAAQFNMGHFKNTCTAFEGNYVTSNTLVSYFLRLLDNCIEYGHTKHSLEVIEAMYKNLHCIQYGLGTKKLELDREIIPKDISVEAIKEFRKKFIKLYLNKPVKDLSLDLSAFL